MAARAGLWASGRRRIREDGQTLAEFAIIVLVLMLCVAGILDFSRAVYVRHLVADAAREGARYATTHPPETAQDVARIKEVARSLMAGFKNDPMVIHVSQPDENHVRVDVTYTFHPLPGLLTGDPKDSDINITMHSGSTMRMEWKYDKDELLPIP